MPRLFPGPVLAVDLSCPDSETCYVTLGDRGVVVTRNGGRSWRKVLTASSENGNILGVTCPTALSCYVTEATPTDEALLTTVNGGRSWHEQRFPMLSNLAGCDGPLRCILNDNGHILLTTDGGVNWRRIPIPLNGALSRITCPSFDTCYGTDYSAGHPLVIVESRDGAVSWTVVLRLAPSMQAALACSSTRHCVVAAGPGPDFSGKVYIYQSFDAGNTWTKALFPTLPARQIPRPAELSSEFGKGLMGF
jgi:photosystem II stability/assembly factor-like uncharacterized protein